jgi:hypothetical protein
METRENTMEELFESLRTYGRTSYDIAKLRALETTTIVVSSLLSRLGFIFIFFLFTLVFNTGVALLLGDLLGKSYYGFFIVAAFYLIAGLVLYFFLYRWIKKPVSFIIITRALN